MLRVKLFSMNPKWLGGILIPLLLACGIVFQSSTIVREDQSSTTRLTIGIDKQFLQTSSVPSAEKDEWNDDF